MRLKHFKIKHGIHDIGFADLIDDSSDTTKESLIAFCKFIELSDKLNQGNYSLNNVSAVSDSIAFFNIGNAILSYQSCYDYFLQILFFGFGFNDDFHSSTEYRKIIKNDCRLIDHDTVEKDGKKYRVEVDSKFCKRIKEYSEANSDFKIFYSQFQSYFDLRSNQKHGISHWANCIKHQGGFITKELYESHRFNNLFFQSNDNSISFSTSEIYAYRPPISEILERLYFQNEKLVEISNWLYDVFFPVRKIAPFQSHILPKDKIYLITNGTE